MCSIVAAASQAANQEAVTHADDLKSLKFRKATYKDAPKSNDSQATPSYEADL